MEPTKDVEAVPNSGVKPVGGPVVQIDEWRLRPLVGDFPYVFLDGLWLKRSWGGEVKNVSVLVAIGVAQTGYREILAVTEGAKEDKASWTQFMRELKERGLKGVELFVSDQCLGLEYGGLQVDQAKRLKELEQENAKLKRLVAELSLDKLVLKDIASGNF